jgi:hypothetical protein
MTNPEAPNTTIITQWVVANELAALIQAHPRGSAFVSDGKEPEPNGGWPTTMSRRVWNITHYLSDDGPYIEIEFLDGTAKRTIRPTDTIEVHMIQPDHDLIEGLGG